MLQLRPVQSNKQMNILKKRERETTKAENIAAPCVVFVDIRIAWGRGLSLPWDVHSQSQLDAALI